jgi:amidohydrolase family protein
VTITSQVNGLSLDSPKLYDFYETACALDVVVFVHPALVPTGYEHLKDYDLPRVLGREVDLTVATTRLIAGGIFDRFPNLKIVIAHFGGGIAAVKDRLIGKGYRSARCKNHSPTITIASISIWQASRAALSRSIARFKGFGRNAWSLPVIIRRISPGSTRTPAKA